MQKILLASTNSGKLSELRSLLTEVPVTLLKPSDIPVVLEVEENEDTYQKNAEKKARSYCLASGLPTLADDTGLEVAALDNFPGLHSARISGSHNATDEERRELLLNHLKAIPHPWLARFVCSVVLALPDGRVISSSGECQGEILPQPRGSNGFGYDPIFLLRDINKTMAELPMQEKNHLSHRAAAIRGILPALYLALGLPPQ